MKQIRRLKTTTPVRVVVLRRFRRIISKLTSTTTKVAVTCVSLVVHAGQPVIGITQLPTGAVVSAGQVSISSTTNANSASMQILQSTPQAVVNWNTFNVGANAQVNIQQPNAQSAILNKVSDSNPSKIYGEIKSNGQVYISNANGVYFSPSSSVEVGGLVATTQTISDADFLAGNLTFNRGSSSAKVVNKGSLKANLGGYIALLAPEVINEGFVIAKMGSVAMASGDAITLNFNKNGSLLGVVTTQSSINTLVENKKAIIAPGGLIILSAAAAQSIQSSVVKVSGSLIATSMVSEGGKIILQGSDVSVASTAKIMANGSAAGGSISVNAAQTLNIQPGAALSASAISSGNGGTVVLSAGNSLNVGGNISAQGGAVAGNGGSVQMTSNGTLSIDSALTVNAGAPNKTGSSGSWTINVPTLNIGSATAAAISSALNTTNVNLNASTRYCEVSCTQPNLGRIELAQDAAIIKNSGPSTSLNLYADNVIDLLGSVTNLASSDLALTLKAPTQVLVGSQASLTATQITASAAQIDILGMLFGTNSGSNNGNGESGNIPLVNLFGVRVSVSGSVRTKSQNGGTSTIDFEGTDEVEITNTAVIDASSNLNGGNIRVVSSSGIVNVKGLIQTNGGSGRGGTIAVSGVVSTTFEGASLNANGLQNGGKILLGNDSENGSLPFSAFTALNSSTSLSAIAVNSTNSSGGFIETSGHTLQMLAAINVGRGGIWLLDPTDIIIDDSSSDANATVKASDISSALISANVVLATSGNPLCTGVTCAAIAGAGTNGDISILSNISWSSANSLTLIADGGVTGTGNIAMTGSGALHINQAQNSVYSGIISGSGALYIEGAGKLTLTGANTYSGGTSITTGSLQIGNGGSAGSIGTGSVVIANNSSLIFALSNNYTFAGDISGDGSLINSGSGTTTLTGSNTYTGGTNITSGVIQVGDGGSTGSIGTGQISISSNKSLKFNLSSTETISQIISGQGSVSLNGTGTVILTGANTYAGTTKINSGTLQIGDGTTNGQLGTGLVTVGSNSTLNFNLATSATFSSGFDYSASGAVIANLSSTAMVTLSGGVNAGLNSVSLMNGGIGGITISGPATPAAPGAGVFVKGNITFSGDLLNTLVISSVGSGTTITFASNATPWFVGSSTTANAPNIIVNSGVTVSENTGQGASNLYYNNISGSGTLNLASSSGSGSAYVLGNASISNLGMSGTGLYIGNAGAGGQLTSANVTTSGGLYFNSSSALTFAGNYGGTGGLTVQGGSLTLTGTNTYSGNTTISTGGLTLASTGVLGGGVYSGNISIASGLSLQYTSSSSQKLSGVISGAGSISQSGSAGTLTLGGNNLYTGGTTVNAGVLQVGSATALGASTSAVSIASGAAIDLGGTVMTNTNSLTLRGTGVNSAGAITNSAATSSTYAGPVSLASAVSIGGSSGNISITGIISGTSSNALTKVGSNTLTLSAANTYLGGTNVNTGTLQLGLVNALPSSGVVSVNSGGALDLNGLVVTNTNAVSLSGTGVSGAGAMTNSSNTAASYAGAVTLTSDASVGGSNGNFTLSGVLTSSSNLTKVGTNVVILSNASNLLTGNLSISAGTLQLSGSATLDGSTYSGAISNSGTLQISTSANLTLAGVISGSGAITKDTANSNTLVISNSNAYSGNTTVSNGTVQFANAQALGTSAVTVASGAMLDLNGYATQNNLTLSGSGNSTGALINSKATAASSSGNITLAANTSIYGSGDITLSGVVSGGFSLTNASAINLILTGQNTYTGATVVTAGNVLVSSSGTLAGGAYGGGISIASGSNFEYLSSANQTLSGAITGAGNLIVTAAGGTLTLSNTSNTFSGTTTVNGSTLSLSSAGSVTNTSITIINGGTLLATGSFSLPKSIVVGSAGNSLGGGLAATSGNTLTENYVISGAGPLLINSSGQTGIVNVGASNSFGGGTTINSGWIYFASDNAFGSAGTTLTLNGGGIQSGPGTITLSTGGTSRPIAIGSSGGSIAANNNTTLTLPGTITATGNYVLNINPLSNQTGLVTLTNAVTVGSISLGNGTLTYTGSSINTTGSTNTLTGALNIASGTTFNYLGTNSNSSYQQFNSITGAGVINFNAGFITLSGDQAFTGNYYFNGATTNITGGSSNVAKAGLGFASAIYITNGTVTLSGVDDSFIGKTSTTPLYMYCLSNCGTTGGVLTTSGQYSYHLGPVTFYGIGSITSPSTGLSTDALTNGVFRFDGDISLINYDSSYLARTTNTNAYIKASAIQLSESGGANINFNQQTDSYYYSYVNSCYCWYSQYLTISSNVLSPGTPNNLTLQNAINPSYVNGIDSLTMNGNLILGKLTANAPYVTLTGSNNIASLYLDMSEVIVGTSSLNGPTSAGTQINFKGGMLGYGSGNSVDYSSQFATTNTSSISIDISNSNSTYTTPITGTNSLTLTGASGVLTLNSVNTFSGGVTVNGGTLKYGSSIVALPITSSVNVESYGLFDINGNTVTLGALKFSGGYSSVSYIKDTIGTGSIKDTPITLQNNSGTLYFSAVISGSSSVTVNDPSSGTYFNGYPLGSSTLSGNNSYTGATVITAGTLILGNNNAIPSTSAVTMNTRPSYYNNIATLNIGSYIDTVASLTAYEGLITGVTTGLNQGMLLTASSAPTAFTFSPPNNYVVTVNAILGGSGGLTHTATASGPNTSGVTVLNSSNVYTGGTYLLGGNLEITAPATSIAQNSMITFNGGTLLGNTNNADLILDTGYQLKFMATGGFAATSAAHSFILPNQLLLNSNATATTTVWYGSLGNNGSVTLPNVDPNGNAYAGTTEIGYGTLNLGASNAISTNSPVWVTNSGTFAMSTYNQAIPSIHADSGNITANTSNANQGVLTMPNTGPTTFLFDPANGVTIQVQANLYSPGGGLTQTVPSSIAAGVDNYGVTYLTGRSSYTGQTYILGGNLSIINNSNIPSGSQINFNGGTLLANATFTLSGYTLSFAPGAVGGFAATSGKTFTIGNVLSNAGASYTSGQNITVWYGSGAGNGTVNLPSGIINNYSGITQLTYGTLAPLMDNAIPTTSSLTLNGGTYSMTTFNQTVTSVNATSGTITATSASPGTLTASAASAQAFNFQPNNGTTIAVGAILASSSSLGGFTQNGYGTTTLQAANTYTGGTTITHGTLSISNDNNLGAVSGPVTFNGSSYWYMGTLYASTSLSLAAGRLVVMAGNGNIETQNTLTIPSVISGNASTLYLNYNGYSGTEVLSGANTYSGILQLQYGTLQMGAANSLPAGSSVYIENSGIFNIGSYNQNVGYVSFDYYSPQLLGSGTLSISNQLRFYNASMTISTPIGGATGNVYVDYYSSITLSGANSYAGGTSVYNNSTLYLGANNTLPSTSYLSVAAYSTLNMQSYSNVVGPVTVQASTITGNGNNNLNGSSYTFNNSTWCCDDNVSVNLIGTGSLTKSGSWTTTLSGTNTYSGGTYLQSGSLNVGASSLPSTGAVYISGGTLNLNGDTHVGAVTYSSNNSNNINTNVGGVLYTNVVNYNYYNNGYINGGTLIGSSWNFTNTGYTNFPYLLTGSESVTQSGPGYTVLTNTSNNYTGGTFVSGGVLQLSFSSTSTASQLPTSGALTINGGTFHMEGYNQTVGAVTASAGYIEGVGIAPKPPTTSPVFAGTPGNNILNGSSYTFTNPSGSTVTVDAILAGTGTLTQSGAGNTVLTNANNTYSGLTTISAGTLTQLHRLFQQLVVLQLVVELLPWVLMRLAPAITQLQV